MVSCRDRSIIWWQDRFIAGLLRACYADPLAVTASRKRTRRVPLIPFNLRTCSLVKSTLRLTTFGPDKLRAIDVELHKENQLWRILPTCTPRALPAGEVYNEARQNIHPRGTSFGAREIALLCESNKGFGDLHNQIKRSAISVVSNIAEGLGSSSQRKKLNFLDIARASNHELLAQVHILCDLHMIQHAALIERVCYVGKTLTKLIQSLRWRMSFTCHFIIKQLYGQVFTDFKALLSLTWISRMS